MTTFDGFVDVYDKNTGIKQRVPEHFMDNPVLSKPFRKTPLAEARDDVAVPEGDPSEAWTNAQLTQYAADQGIDLGGATVKADILTAITHHESPSGGEEE